MTQTETKQIDKYLKEVKGAICDFGIEPATLQAELPKLEEVITEIMVASVESEDGTGGVMLYYLEEKARHCRELILIRMGKKN